MKAITKEKREIIISAKQRREKVETIALWTGVGISSIYRIWSKFETTDSIETKPYPGRKKVITSEQLAQIRETIEAENDITLAELIDKLDLPIKKSRLSVILIDMGLSFKKRHSIPKLNSAKISKPNVVTGKNIKMN